MHLRRPETDLQTAVATAWAILLLGYAAFGVLEYRTGLLELGTVDALLAVGTAVALAGATVAAYRSD